MAMDRGLANGEARARRRAILYALGVGGTFGQVALLCVAWSKSASGDGRVVAATWGVGALVSLVAAGAGAFCGFLFGVPQSADTTSADGGPTGFKPNVKIEAIADWLIKIGLGVGLTQLQRLPGAFTRLGAWLAPALGGSPADPVFGVAIIGAYLTLGFFVGYLIGFADGPSLLAGALESLKPSVRTINAATFTPTQDGKPARLPDDAEPDARRLRAMPLEDLETPEQKLAWARAQASAGGYDEARRAFDDVAKSHPTVAKAHEDLGAKLDEGAMYAALYEAAPDGFEKAIQIGKALVDRNLARQNTYGYFACAYGQKHAWAVAHGDVAAAEEARAQVLKYVALLADSPSWRSVLRRSLDESSPSSDDDLTSLKDDREIRERLAATPRSTPEGDHGST